MRARCRACASLSAWNASCTTAGGARWRQRRERRGGFANGGSKPSGLRFCRAFESLLRVGAPRLVGVQHPCELRARRAARVSSGGRRAKQQRRAKHALACSALSLLRARRSAAASAPRAALRARRAAPAHRERCALRPSPSSGSGRQASHVVHTADAGAGRGYAAQGGSARVNAVQDVTLYCFLFRFRFCVLIFSLHMFQPPFTVEGKARAQRIQLRLAGAHRKSMMDTSCSTSGP